MSDDVGSNGDDPDRHELMERVGVEDGDRFNDHLGQFVGTFVKKEVDGYRLRLSE